MTDLPTARIDGPAALGKVSAVLTMREELMGQAKQRGTAEQRAEQAKQRIDALKPSVIVCNECETETGDITILDTRGLRGLDAAFAGLCPKCKAVTYAFKGDPVAIARFSEVMAEQMGGDPQLGIQNANGRIR